MSRFHGNNEVSTGTKEGRDFVDQSKGTVLSTDMEVTTGYNRTAIIAKPSENVSSLSLDYLRLAAETYYVTDLNGITVPELSDLPQFHSLPLHKLMIWHKNGGWAEKRLAFQEKCSRRVQEAVSNKLVKLRLEQMDKIKELCDDIWAKIKDPDAPIKVLSYEGIVKTYLQAVETMEKLRDSVTIAIGDKTVHPDTETRNNPDIQISSDEARDLATELIKRRQLQAANKDSLITEGEIVEPSLDK